jgi:ribosomal protein L37E
MFSLVDDRDEMATSEDTLDDMTEECDRCGRATPHAVTVEILTESPHPENAEFSREPYRVAECAVCGAVERTRMNNA